MQYLVKVILASGLMLSAVSVFAQDDADEERPLGWTGVGELGFVSTTRRKRLLSVMAAS